MKKISIVFGFFFLLIIPQITDAHPGFSKTFKYSIDSFSFGHLINDVIYDSVLNVLFFSLSSTTSNNGRALYYDVFTKIDTSGNVIQQKPIINTDFHIKHESLLLTKDKEFLFWFGSAFDSDINDSTTMDYLITKTDVDFNIIWQRRYENAGIRNAYIRDVQEDSDGNITFLGSKYTYSGEVYPPVDAKMILIKIDTAGNVLWENSLGHSTNNYMIGWHSGTSLFQNEDNTYFAFGMTYGYGVSDYSPVIFKADANGNELEHHIYMQNYTSGVFLCTTPINSLNKTFINGGLVIGPGSNAFVNCTDEMGNELWQKVFPANIRSRFSGITFDTKSNEAVLVGSNRIDTYPANPSSTMTLGYIVKIDTLGNEIWHKKILHDPNRNADHYLYEVITLNSGSIIAVGSAFEPGYNYSCGWVLKLDKNGCLFDDCRDVLGIENGITEKNTLTIYPNPTSGRFTIYQENVFVKGTQISILDISGRLIKQLPSPENRNLMEYDIADLSPNLYILQIQNNTSTKYIKLDLIK